MPCPQEWPARTQTLGVHQRGLGLRPGQPPALAIHTEGLPAGPVPLAGSVLTILVTLQAHLILLTVGDTWNQR